MNYRRRIALQRSHALILISGCLAIVAFLTITGIFTVNVLKMNGSQFLLSAIIFVVSIVIGLVWKLVLDAQEADGNITWTELVVGGLVVGILFSWIGVNIGWKMAFDNVITYNEYWNGWELTANSNDVTCTEDGYCYHTYNCHPYTVLVTETYDCGTQDNPATCTRLVPETKYHSCPYVTHETTYSVHTSLGDYPMGQSCMPDNPDQNRWDAFTPVYVGNACVGVPPLWASAKARIDSGHPGPATQRNTYKNYILASDTTLFKQYSSQIDEYKAAGVLPDLRRDLRDYYQADKVYFVGYTPSNPASWQSSHSYLNAALGTELQGDLHLVIIQNSYVTANPTPYCIALKAYWQNPEIFGKDTLSKNSIVVVLGTTDGMNVEWACATTGMPIGNETMLTAIQNHMAGTPLTPDAILGIVDGQFYQKVKADGSTKLAVKGLGDTGVLRRIFWGFDDPATKFARISMTANDQTDNGTGFNYLKENIKPTFGQQLAIVLVCLFLSIILWGAEAYFVGDLRSESY